MDFSFFMESEEVQRSKLELEIIWVETFNCT